MSARDKLHARLFKGPQEDRDDLLDAYRVDVLSEAEVEIALAIDRNRAEHPDEEAMVTRRLGMRAAERVVRGMREETEQEPTAPLAAPDFFQPGRTYASNRHADLLFECLALSADPDTGEQQAIGWRYGPPHNGIRRHKLAALGSEDWACCIWAETAEEVSR